MNFTIKTFNEVQHLIPNNSLYAHHYNQNELMFLLIDGDYHFERPLDLFDVEAYFGLDTGYYTLLNILITGNCTAGNICCGEMDYGSGLIVLGDLTADNMVVSGQEIYVVGDLRVNGLFWGDYNHGELVVMGEIHSKVFLATDYGYDDERFKSNDRIFIAHQLSDSDKNYQNYPNPLTALLKDKLLFNEKQVKENHGKIWSYKCWVNEKVLFESLENDERNLLKSDEEIHFHLIEIENSEKSSQEKRTPIFSDKLISVQNLLKFTYPPYFNLMKSPLPTNGEKVEIWDNNVFYRISYKEEKNHHSFYIQNLGDDYLAVYLEYENGETGMYYRTQSGEDLSPITSENQAEYAFLQEQWERFLPRWEEIVYQMQKYSEVVNKGRFFEILNSEKIAEVYQNFQNIQKSTYVNVRGGNYFAMLKRNPPYRHRISIAEHSGFDSDDNELYAFYHFEWDEALERVILLTQDGNGEQFSPYEIDFSQTHLYHTATKLFANIEEMLWI